MESENTRSGHWENYILPKVTNTFKDWCYSNNKSLDELYKEFLKLIDGCPDQPSYKKFVLFIYKNKN